MRWTSLFRLAIAAGGLLLAAAAPAEAQWYLGVQFGANRTQSSTVSVEAPSQGVSQQFHDVHFDARSFSAPPYYGWRAGRVLTRKTGVTYSVEFEFIHAKVYSDTSRTYVVTPIGPGTPINARMDATVQRYNMSHGLNFALANLVIQAPLKASGKGPMTLNLRAGIGPTIPHAESTVMGESTEQYEYGGMAFGGGVGIGVHLTQRVSGMFEYKVTYSRPEITLAHGTGRANVLMHNLIAGVIVRLTQ